MAVCAERDEAQDRPYGVEDKFVRVYSGEAMRWCYMAGCQGGLRWKGGLGNEIPWHHFCLRLVLQRHSLERARLRLSRWFAVEREHRKGCPMTPRGNCRDVGKSSVRSLIGRVLVWGTYVC